MPPTIAEILSPEFVPDGRHRRTDASRTKIVAALIALVREGNPLPGAEAVAERAGVGLRTVFRLFRDMDGLYSEMKSAMVAQVKPLFGSPLPQAGWPDVMRSLCHRRAQVFEEIMPLLMAAQAHRFRSAFLQESYADFLQIQRAMLQKHLPNWLIEDQETVNALDAAMSFEMWRHMRLHQSLSVEEAESLMLRLITPLLQQAPQ